MGTGDVSSITKRQAMQADIIDIWLVTVKANARCSLRIRADFSLETIFYFYAGRVLRSLITTKRSQSFKYYKS